MSLIRHQLENYLRLFNHFAAVRRKYLRPKGIQVVDKDFWKIQGILVRKK